MSASQPALFNVQEFTDNGVTLVGGRLYTYAYGTTTQKVAYTDPEGAVPQTYTADGLGGQYIALNARGELATSLYLASGVYDLTLRRADGSVVWTRQANASVSGTALALPSGADLIGLSASGAGAVPTTIGFFLNNIHGVDVTLFGANPAASSAVNTAAINAANAIGIASGRPVYFPPIGTYKIRRLTTVTGMLSWYSGHSSGCIIQVDNDAWPYAASNAAILEIAGTFYAENITFDQSWLRASMPGGHASVGTYRDDRNPITWGGYWFVRMLSSVSDSCQVRDCHFKNIFRGIFSEAADKSVGGLKRFEATGCTAESLDSDSQTVFAAEAPKSSYIADCPDIVTRRWTDGASYISNGLSAIFMWGGDNVRIINNGLVGYQSVQRGPGANPWQPSRLWQVGEEFIFNNSQSYRVNTAYTSGASFGATDLANSSLIFNPMRNIMFCLNRVDTPIADTAVYGWSRGNVDNNNVSNSGDMGIACSGTSYISARGNIIDSVRIGCLDVSGGGVVVASGNICKDWARGASGKFVRIDSLNPSVHASNQGFSLAAVTVSLTSAPGTQQVIIADNNCYMETLPPVTDNGPLNGGIVRAAVLGIYSATSSNTLAQNTVNCTGNYVQDAEVDMPNCLVLVATLRFYCDGTSGIVGTPQAGEIFSNGSVKFVLVSTFGNGGLIFVRKFQGASGPFGGQSFTGSRSGAVITTAALPQTAFIASGESGNIDYTSKYLGDTVNDNLRGVANVDPSSVASGAQTSFTIGVTGSAIGDYVMVAPPYQIQGLQMTAYISGAGVITVILKNDTGAPINLAAGIWRARVLQG